RIEARLPARRLHIRRRRRSPRRDRLQRRRRASRRTVRHPRRIRCRRRHLRLPRADRFRLSWRAMARDRLKDLDEFTLADLESVRLVLRGDSVVDWHRLNFSDEDEVREFIMAQEFHPDEPADRARINAIKAEAISYLRRHFEYPIP